MTATMRRSQADPVPISTNVINLTIIDEISTRRSCKESITQIGRARWKNSGSSKQRLLISLPIACRFDWGLIGNDFAERRIANNHGSKQNAGHVAPVFCELAY